MAAVMVSVVNIRKGGYATAILDGKTVPFISAFLVGGGSDDSPVSLKANTGKSFQGSIVLGMGFTFDDENLEKGSSPIRLMHDLLAKDARNQQRIFPYLGGDEINTSPTHSPHRHVISFGQMDEAAARAWPDLIDVIEKKVRGKRAAHSTAEWWHFERLRPELYTAVDLAGHALAVARTSKYLGFVWLPMRTIFSENLIVFALPSAAFPVLQSNSHLTWVSFTSSTLEDRQGYRPTDCFETFPFPPAGRPAQPSNPLAKPITTSAPPSWSATTRA
jgi:hypothetical protein